MKKTISKLLLYASAIAMVSFYLVGCKKDEIKISTTDDVNIVGYLDKHLDSFSLFRQILERTETAAFLNAYGAYTCFAVTNNGVQTWLNSMGASSVAAADINKLKDMVKLHLLGDTLTTASFTDGKLPVVTMYGQYLVTSITTKYNVAGFLVNRQGFVLQGNIKTGNGLIHVLDNVLQPATLTLAKTLEAKPEYSIFLQAVRAAGYYDLLNTNNNPDPNKLWLTLLAESNQALADSGITSYAQLKAKYSQTGNPALANDTLNLYVAYHIIPGIKFLGDIIQSQSQATLAPQEVVSSKLDDQQRVLINDDIFNGIREQGIELLRGTSDIAATNGVIHTPKSHFNLKYRKPTAVYWDVSAFDEIRKLTAYYQKQSYTFNKLTEAEVPIKDITWPLPALTSTSFLTYSYSTASTITNYACNADVNIMPLGGPSRPLEVTYRTPTIIKGRYKVWVCYRQQKQSTSSVCQCNVFIDGVAMQRPFTFTDTRPAGGDGDLEAIFYKRYTENTSNLWVGRLVGIANITTTERHSVRIVAISGTQNNNNLDMIHFIPENDNQILPRFKPDGTQLFQ